MAWDDIVQQARAVVHVTFQREALYYPSSNVSGSGVPVMVRLHSSQVVTTGDLDREGYSQVYEDVERLVFTQADVTTNSIQRGGYVRRVANGQLYRLELREPTTDDYSVSFQVVRVSG
jgi:hypothetical protein